MEKDLVITLTVENQVKPEPYPVESERFGCTIGDFLGTVDEDGVYSAPTTPVSFVGNGIKNIGANAFSNAFAEKDFIVSAEFPDLEEMTGERACLQMFYNCVNLEHFACPKLRYINSDHGFYSMFTFCKIVDVDMSSVQEIGGTYSCGDMFASCKSIKSVNLENLEIINGQNSCNRMFTDNVVETINIKNLKTINGTGACSMMFATAKITSLDLGNLESATGSNCCKQMFYSNQLLEEVNLNKLHTLGVSSFSYTFYNCKALKKISFPALKTVETNSFGTKNWSGGEYIFVGCTALTEIHFRADMQATIEAMVGYDTKWGATNARIIFDL